MGDACRSSSTFLHQVEGIIPPAGRDFAARIGALHKETSALTGQGVWEVFNEVCLEVRPTDFLEFGLVCGLTGSTAEGNAENLHSFARASSSNL